MRGSSHHNVLLASVVLVSVRDVYPLTTRRHSQHERRCLSQHKVLLGSVVLGSVSLRLFFTVRLMFSAWCALSFPTQRTLSFGCLDSVSVVYCLTTRADILSMMWIYRIDAVILVSLSVRL